MNISSLDNPVNPVQIYICQELVCIAVCDQIIGRNDILTHLVPP